MPSARHVAVVRCAPYFPVPDVSSIGAYYRDVLGFQCEYTAGNPPEFALFSRGASAIMFRRVPDERLICPNEKQGGTWDAFLWTDDVEALYGEMTHSGAAIVYPPTIQSYGMKEFAVRDPNGYVLGLGQVW